MKKLLFILILFLFSPTIVFAGEYDDSFRDADFISDVYINKFKSGEDHYNFGRFIRSKTDGSIAYCIEPFELIDENIEYSSYDINPEKQLGMSSEDWNKISLIAYYGYGYGTHTSAKWYSITQIMIWRVVDPEAEFYFTDKLFGKETSLYDAEIAEINELVNNHNILPSFANKSYVYSIGEKFVLTDTNMVLKDYSISNSSDTDIRIEDNNLVLSSPTKSEMEVEFIKRYENYNRPAVAFVDSNSKNIMTPGNPAAITFKINVKTETGTIKIDQVDFDTGKKEPLGSAKLIGTEYTIYNSLNEVVEVLTINENYEAMSKELPFGRYTIKETKNMEGYLPDTKEYVVEIDKDNLITELTLKKQVISSKIEIYKYFGDEIEEGISFEIYDSDGNFVDKVITNEYGKIEKELCYGRYTFHQLNTTKNYLKTGDFEVNIDESSEPVIRVELYSEKFYSKLLILKKDSETGKIINSEVIYNIYNVTNGEYITIDDSIDLKTNNGILEIEKLYAGTYIIEEIKAPIGYKKENNKIKIIIDDENEFKYDSDNYPIYEISTTSDKEVLEIEVPNTNQEYTSEIQLFFEDKRRNLKKRN